MGPFLVKRATLITKRITTLIVPIRAIGSPGPSRVPVSRTASLPHFLVDMSTLGGDLGHKWKLKLGIKDSRGNLCNPDLCRCSRLRKPPGRDFVLLSTDDPR